MTLRVATDEDVRGLPAAAAVQTMREVLALRGDLLAPPRIRAELGEFDFVYTAGRLPTGASGLRVYRAGRPAGTSSPPCGRRTADCAASWSG
jgi:hypothetical protein